jgi:hypothetical protein
VENNLSFHENCYSIKIIFFIFRIINAFVSFPLTSVELSFYRKAINKWSLSTFVDTFSGTIFIKRYSFKLDNFFILRCRQFNPHKMSWLFFRFLGSKVQCWKQHLITAKCSLEAIDFNCWHNNFDELNIFYEFLSKFFRT